jgi:isopenicillin-N epimerase
MAEAKCAETGATPLVVQIPIPTTADDVVARIKAALTPAVKLAILDHITSPTALVLPLERIIPLLHANGTRVFIDGAHTIGQIPLDLAALGADWYVSNAHKWLYAPKGSAFLYAAPDVAAMTQPNIVSHHIAMGFPKSFDFTGTRDNTAWLTIPAALKFFHDLGPEAVWAHEQRLVTFLRAQMNKLGASPVGPADMCAAMASFILPTRTHAQPGDQLTMMQDMWRAHRIQIAGGVLDGKLLLRVSTQAYVSEDDLVHMVETLDRTGWPRR